MKELKKHTLYYLILLLVLVLGIFTALKVREVFLLLPLFYGALGILHHAHEHTLTVKIMVEYILIASIGMVIFSFLLVGKVI